MLILSQAPRKNQTLPSHFQKNFKKCRKIRIFAQINLSYIVKINQFYMFNSLSQEARAVSLGFPFKSLPVFITVLFETLGCKNLTVSPKPLPPDVANKIIVLPEKS